MLLSFCRKLEVPAEIWYEILRNLNQRSLKRVRLVCAELAALTKPLLFKSISISPLIADVERFLNITRDPELSRAVEELVYREMHFKARPEHWTQLEGAEHPYEATIRMHLQSVAWDLQDSFERLQISLGPNDIPEDEAAMAFNPDRIHNILDQILQEYESQAAAVNSGSDFAALKQGLSVMVNLKRIITRDSRPSGISTDTGFEPSSLSLLHAHFPASDASLRLGILSDPVDAPAHGFFTILRALAATGANIPMLVTERTTGLLKQGIPLNLFSKNAEFHQTYAQGFRHLRMISLCIDDDGAAVPIETSAEVVALSACIQAATNLEHLELSLTRTIIRTESYLLLRCLLPYTALRKLHTLVLEGIPTTANEITSFLVLQAGSLQHLTLWNVQLVAEDLWERVLASLSACERFHLDSFTLKNPEDADVREHQEIWEVPARIPDERVLRFVNEGGLNPFTERDWRLEPPIDTDVDAGSEVSDHSDVSDFSVWKDTQTDDSQDIDYDEDGPEFNSDYDTEPDFESDGTSDDFDLSDVNSASLV